MRKGKSEVLAVLIFLAILAIVSIGKYIKENLWIVVVVVLALAFIIFLAHKKAKEERRCKECLSENTTMTDHRDEIIGWQYMTIHGNPDRRRKNNKAIHLFTEEYQCKDCGHIFEIEHTYEK